MSGVRGVLTSALQEHEWRGGILGCACGWNWPDERTYFCGEDERIAKAHAEHVADAIVALPGVAVVQLPEPDHHVQGDEFENGRTEYALGDVSVFEDGEIHLLGAPWKLSDFKHLAASMVAAVVVAERVEETR